VDEPQGLVPGDHRKECCRKEENLVAHQERPDLIIRRCKVCGCRHFELSVDVGRLGLKGQGIGAG
jgi:hypothetical protein